MLSLLFKLSGSPFFSLTPKFLKTDGLKIQNVHIYEARKPKTFSHIAPLSTNTLMSPDEKLIDIFSRFLHVLAWPPER